MIQHLSTLIGRPKPDCIYEIIGHIPLDLCLDVGAAAGKTARRICLAGGVTTRLMAFEPFKNNHKFFRQSTKDLPNDIRLLGVALSDRVGTSQFVVSSTVRPGTPGWDGYVGYSSLGFLKDSVSQKPSIRRGLSYLKALARSLRKSFFARSHSEMLTLTVPTTTTDAVLPEATISFMKIDVQGAEAKVLRGASAALSADRIKILYVEWAGDPDVVQLLSERNYKIFDTLYLAIPNEPGTRPFEKIGFQVLREINLSTGRTAYEMLFPDDQLSPFEALSRAQDGKLGRIQTDLIAVNSTIESEFLTAANLYREKQVQTS